MNIVFTGPPLAGKGTQATLLGQKLNTPVFSIGALLRDNVKDGYRQYAMKGHNLPAELKFDLLKEKLDTAKDGFILENFPATEDDLKVFLTYLAEHGLRIDKVFNITISDQEARKRMQQRGRIDDTQDIVEKRRDIQGKDREPVLEYFRKLGVLVNIDGEGLVEDVHKRIVEKLSI